MISPTQISVDESRPLGTGGFGTVYRGVWEGADVAVKRLVDETSDQIFLKQVKLWLELRHPHVLQLFGASDIDFKPLYFVTQYFRHGNINQYLSKSDEEERSIEANSYLQIHEISLGMQYLHGRKLIHGDLKPSNILVSDNLQACIADFGLSEMKLDSNDRSSIGGGRRDMVAGSPRYFRYVSDKYLVLVPNT
ncbi:kinase-like protein [Ceratobasidium sp. AG-I]|nr:kinase-like protein [Ceratobasidium sp. AG-I]